MLKALFLIVACLPGYLLGVTSITLPLYKSITQMSSGTQFFAWNLGFMNGYFYSLYGFGFNRASAAGTSYTLQTLNQLTSSLSINYAIYTMVAIPDASKLLWVSSDGTVYVIDPNNSANPIVAKKTLDYFGYNTANIAVYQIERKPNTNYFYLTALIGKTIQRIDFTDLSNPLRILSGPVSDMGYERLSASPDNTLVILSVNGLRADVFDMSANAFVKSLNLPTAWQGVAYRGVKHYPRVQHSDFFFITSTAQIAYLVNVAQSTTDKMFTIPGVFNGDSIKYLENTRFMAVMSLTRLYFINMDGTDADTKEHTLAYSVTDSVMLTVLYNSVYYLATTFYPGNGMTYMFDLSTYFCHFSCATCTKSMDGTACSTCQPGYAQSGAQCMPIAPPGQVVLSGSPAASCPAGQYKNFDFVCTACPAGCSACKDFTGYCSTCTSAPNSITPQGQCVASCTSHQFSQTVSTTHYCNECHPSCLTCSGSSSNQCSTCDGAKSFIQSGNICTDRCVGAGTSITSYITMNDTCSQCTGVGNCKQCTYPNLAFSCTQCTGGYYSYNGVCVGTCPTGLIVNSNSMTCEACEEKGLDQIYFNGSCISNTQCPSGYTYASLKCSNSSTQTTTTNPFTAPNSTLTNSTNNSTVNSSSSSAADTGSGSGSIILYVILGLVLLAVIGIGIYCYMRHRKNKQIQSQISPMQNPNIRAAAPMPQYPAYPYPQQYGHQQNPHNEEGQEEDDGDWDLGESQGQGRQFQNYPRRNPEDDVPPMQVVNMGSKPSQAIIVPGQKPAPTKFIPNSANEWSLGEEARPTGGRLMDSHMSEMNQLSGRLGAPETNPIGRQQPLEAGFSQYPQNNSPQPRRTLQKKNL